MNPKFSVGTKVDYVSPNNRVLKGNYVTNIFYKRSGVTYELANQDGVRLVSEEKHISLSQGGITL